MFPAYYTYVTRKTNYDEPKPTKSAKSDARWAPGWLRFGDQRLGDRWAKARRSFCLQDSHVGQLIVHLAVNQDVAGLSPAVRAKYCPMV